MLTYCSWIGNCDRMWPSHIYIALLDIRYWLREYFWFISKNTDAFLYFLLKQQLIEFLCNYEVQKYWKLLENPIDTGVHLKKLDKRFNLIVLFIVTRYCSKYSEKSVLSKSQVLYSYKNWAERLVTEQSCRDSTGRQREREQI